MGLKGVIWVFEPSIRINLAAWSLKDVLVFVWGISLPAKRIGGFFAYPGNGNWSGMVWLGTGCGLWEMNGGDGGRGVAEVGGPPESNSREISEATYGLLGCRKQVGRLLGEQASLGLEPGDGNWVWRSPEE